MLDRLREWFSYGPFVAVFFLFIVVASSLSILLIKQQITVEEIEVIETAKLREKLMLTLTWPSVDEGLVYQPISYLISNEQNHSVQLRMDVSSNPSMLMGYMTFSISVENGTVLRAGETLPFILDITTYSNPENIQGDYYLKIYGEPL